MSSPRPRLDRAGGRRGGEGRLTFFASLFLADTALELRHYRRSLNGPVAGHSYSYPWE